MVMLTELAKYKAQWETFRMDHTGNRTKAGRQDKGI